ncbi:MAG TPA: tetratricopeptide repeat protein [Rhodothermales bacterium]|nr:tetratricopeptide repeat protein [Rhodothermales bacterium]
MKTLPVCSLLVLAGVLCPISTATAQSTETTQLLLDTRARITEGWHRLDRTILAEAAATASRTASDRANAAFAHYYAGLALYHQVSLVRDDEPTQLRLINEAITHLEAATNQRRNFADALALLSTALGRKVMLHTASAFTQGPRIGQLMSRARRLEPSNPRVAYLEAVALYSRPKLLGGDKARGLEGLQRAAVLFEQEIATGIREALLPSWGREDVQAWIGLAHLEAGRLSEADAAFQRALELAPSFGWVQRVLMPRLAAARAQSNS